MNKTNTWLTLGTVFILTVIGSYSIMVNLEWRKEIELLNSVIKKCERLIGDEEKQVIWFGEIIGER